MLKAARSVSIRGSAMFPVGLTGWEARTGLCWEQWRAEQALGRGLSLCGRGADGCPVMGMLNSPYPTAGPHGCPGLPASAL